MWRKVVGVNLERGIGGHYSLKLVELGPVSSHSLNEQLLQGARAHTTTKMEE